jgi:glycolate oxidase iron-sulfur subunit
VGAGRERVGVLVGCVQEGLYGHLNRATVRVLEANGYDVVEVLGQDCCGALHAHGGGLDRARHLARVNVEAFERAGVSRIAVNTAGCGAAMKEYGTLLEDDGSFAERATAVASRVRDVTELLSEVGPRAGAEVRCRVAYDHPCHLVHGQGVRQPPLDVLAAVPGVEVTVVDNADECCGGAGIYGITHPDLGGQIGGDKVAAVRRVSADAACTPNPGCMMQIGAGLRLPGAPEGVVHPVELLDESYRRAGFYDRARR